MGVYDMRLSRMSEWMDNVDKAIGRIMADKVYTSAEFKRERDTFHSLCKDLERAEVKKWLGQIIEILMADRNAELKKNENQKLEALILKHEEIVPSCVENVEELIERQEKSLSQLDAKRHIVTDLIAKGKTILENPDKPKFLEGNVQRIEVGWDDTKQKAQDRLVLLNDTKDAFVGYGENNETIATEFELAEEEIKKVKKHFNLEAADKDLKKRQAILKDTCDKISGLFDAINANVKCLSITIPEDKKKLLDKETKEVGTKLEVLDRFKKVVAKIEDLFANLTAFDTSLKTLDTWMLESEKELKDIKDQSGSMTPEDRVARTMDLQEDIASKLEILKENAKIEAALLPQASDDVQVPADAQCHKDELKRITDFVTTLQKNTMKECDAYSNDVKLWAEYMTGVKEFTPWLVKAEQETKAGLSKPTDLEEVKSLHNSVGNFNNNCKNFLKVLEAAHGAAKKMTTHEGADNEIAALKKRYDDVKAVADTWVSKVDVLLKEWVLLDSTVSELNSWVAKEKTSEGENQFSLEKMESTLGELKAIFKEKEKLVDNL